MIKILKSGLLLFVLYLSTVSGYSQKKEDSAPFFFIQVTDPQFGFFSDNKGFDKETELYGKAVKEINRLKPDFVVITGDLVNNKEDQSQITEFKRISDKISKDIPVYFTPGNHDIGQAPSQRDIDTFIKNYGHDRFSFTHKGSLFIGLNSCLIKSDIPELEQKQEVWLKEILSKGKAADHIVIFCHYPFFINIPEEPETYSNIPIDTRNRFLALFKQFKVSAVFAGHLHNNGYGKSGDMEMVTTSAVGKPLGKIPSGFRIIKVLPDRIESNYYSLDEIPETISLTVR